MYVPTRYKVVCGTGRSKHRLASFDAALIDAGICNYNLVRVSSILPPSCLCVEDELLPPPGSIVFTAYATISSNCIGDDITSAISVGIPKNSSCPGVIMEHEIVGCTTDCVNDVEAMVAEAMKRRNLPVLQVVTRSSEARVTKDEYVTTFAGIIMW